MHVFESSVCIYTYPLSLPQSLVMPLSLSFAHSFSLSNLSLSLSRCLSLNKKESLGRKVQKKLKRCQQRRICYVLAWLCGDNTISFQTDVSRISYCHGYDVTMSLHSRCGHKIRKKVFKFRSATQHLQCSDMVMQGQGISPGCVHGHGKPGKFKI